MQIAGGAMDTGFVDTTIMATTITVVIVIAGLVIMAAYIVGVAVNIQIYAPASAYPMNLKMQFLTSHLDRIFKSAANLSVKNSHLQVR